MLRFPVSLFVLVLALAVFVALSLTVESGTPEDFHTHADFKLYLNGEQFDFSAEKYMSSNGRQLNPFMHLHDGEGEVIHQHFPNISVGSFFKSLGMQFNSTCIVLDDATSYCSNAEGTLGIYVNGVPNNQFADYVFNDLDRVLITYGPYNETVINNQIQSVSDRACIYSEKCPSRGIPNDESSCTVGDDACAPVGV